MQIEDTINETVKFYHNEKNKNCIIIYDRGAMDPVACNILLIFLISFLNN